MRFLVAFDKFKHSLTSEECNKIAYDVIKEKSPDSEILCLPISDGGEGFIQFQSQLLGVKIEFTNSTNYLRQEQQVPYLFTNRELYIEYSSVCGLQTQGTDSVDLWNRSSEALAYLMDKLIKKLSPVKIFLGIGGSGTQDFGEGFYHLAKKIDLKNIPLQVICDVETKMKSDKGGVFLYGPQKGMLPLDQEKWSARLDRVVRELYQDSGIEIDLFNEDCLGASGGLLLGLKSYFSDIEVVKGSALLEKIIFSLGKFDYLLTGEGCLDEGSLEGKGAFAMALNLRRIKNRLFFCGVNRLNIEYPEIEIISISDPKTTKEINMTNAALNLSQKISNAVINRPTLVV